MRHIYKAGGDWSRDGIDYTIEHTQGKTPDGWYNSFSDMKASIEPVEVDWHDLYEKAFNKKPSARMKDETIKKKVEEWQLQQ